MSLEVTPADLNVTSADLVRILTTLGQVLESGAAAIAPAANTPMATDSVSKAARDSVSNFTQQFIPSSWDGLSKGDVGAQVLMPTGNAYEHGDIAGGGQINATRGTMSV